jgi:hypothetical protein
MVRTKGRARPLWQALACATFAIALAGCGGGGGGGASKPPDTGGGDPPTESAYLLAEFVAGDANNQFVRVWDPAHPAVAIQNVKLVQGNGIVWTSSHLAWSDATRYDAATRTSTTLGHAKVFYDNDGKLYAIDLRGGQSHVPVQLSSAVDVFIPTGVVPMNAAGDDAWVDVQGGSHHWAIRTSMAATAAPVSIQQIVAPLRDPATGLPRLFFASLGSHTGSHAIPTTYELADASFTRLPEANVDGMVAADGWLGVDPVQPGLAYVRIAGQARALRWSGAAAAVDPTSLYPFTGIAGPTIGDAQALYFCDDNGLHALANGVESRVGTFSAQPVTLFDSGSTIAALEATGVVSAQVDYQLEVLAKSDGTLTLVEPTSSTLQVFGASGDTLVLAGTPEQGQAFVLVGGGGAGSRTTVGAQAVGVVRAADAHVDQPAAPVALTWCAPGAASGLCGAGPLVQQSLAGVDTTLGTLATGGVALRGEAIAGLATALGVQTFLPAPGGFGGDETNQRDAWQFVPGAAGSLARVTSNLP